MNRQDVRTHVQAEVLARIRDSLRQLDEDTHGYVVALHAPTGIGKTKTILDLAEELDEYDFVVFVRTRTELSAWVKNSLKFYSRLPSITLAKGLSCTLTVAETADALPCHRCRLRREIEEFDYEYILNTFRRLSTYDPYKVAEYLRRQRVGFCIYSIFKQLGRISGSRIHVYTYPYLFRTGLHTILLRDLGIEDVSEARQEVIAVCDEAHCLEKLFLNPDIRVSIPILKQVLVEVDAVSTRVEQEVGEDISDTADLVRDLALYLTEIIEELSERLRDEDVLPSAKLVDLVESNLGPVRELSRLLDTLRNIAARVLAQEVREELALTRLAHFISALEHVDDESTVLVYSQEGLEVRNVDTTKLYRECLADYKAAILMSGTLQDKEYLARVWGIPHKKLKYLDYSDVRLGQYEVYVVPNLTSLYVARRRFLDAYAHAIEQIYELAEKNVLAVFTSYSMMKSVYSRLSKSLREVTYVETPETKLGQVEEFVKKLNRENTRALIFAVADGRLVEGIELTDEDSSSLISDVVIAGYPAPPPTGYVKLLLTRLSKLSGLSKDYIVKQWVFIKVKQALGRAIRSPRDRARFWLLDVRFRDKEIQELLRLEDVQEVKLGV